MTRRIIVLCSGTVAACLALLAAAVFPALAEEALRKGPAGEAICAPRAKLIARLERGRDFALQGQGLRDTEAMMEVRADADGNWLLLQNYADGLSCLVAMGEAWEAAIPAQQPEAGPSLRSGALSGKPSAMAGKTDPT